MTERLPGLTEALWAISHFSPEHPMVLTPSQYEDAMKIPEIAAMADRMIVVDPIVSYETEEPSHGASAEQG